ncbi:MAG: hypothetical protein IPM54_35020 [Polyangiaceae bacterium]|nr:hypothetical protein [Polyangiaceae bacterium]
MMFTVDPREVLNAGIAGKLTAYFLVVSILIALVGFGFALAGPRRERTVPLVVFAAASISAFVLGLGAAVVVVHRAQRSILDGYSSTHGWSSWNDAIDVAESTHASVGIALGLVSVLLGLAAIVHAFRARRDAARAPVLLPCCFALLTAGTAIGMLRRAYAVGHSPSTALVAAEVEWVKVHGDEYMASAHLWVFGIAIAASAILLLASFWNERKPPIRVPRSAWAASATMAAIGISAWVVTRPIAHDAKEAIPWPEPFPGHRCPTIPSGTASLPKMSSVDAPCSWTPSKFIVPLAVIDFGAPVPLVDGVPVHDPTHANRVVGYRVIEHDPRNRMPPLFVAAPATMQASDIGPWLAAMPRDLPAAIVVAHDQPTVWSKTAGPIPRTPRCSCPIVNMSPSGAGLAGYTWEQIAGAAASAIDEPLVIAP